jgi:hypothetical protein
MNKDASEYEKEVIKDREGQKKGDRDMVKMMMTFITQRGESQGKTKKERNVK